MQAVGNVHTEKVPAPDEFPGPGFYLLEIYPFMIFLIPCIK